ncbi:MAG: acireductone synthase [Thermoplasmataceae archaeon]|jgi:enolase-phosphatase E1
MMQPKAVLLDIEGTTTPKDFVYRKLFPFAKEHLNEFLDAHSEDVEVQKCLSKIIGNYSQVSPHDKNAGRKEITDLIVSLIDSDSKFTAFKELQAMIWNSGYASGELKGEVYPDVPPAIKRWHDSGIVVSIYSSGSVPAQKAIFSTTQYGDLTRYIFSYFDTNVGPKNEPDSYERISGLIGVDPSRIVFVSDSVIELQAADASGFMTYLSVRPGMENPPNGKYRVIRNFSELRF